MDKIRVQFIGVPVPNKEEDEFFRSREIGQDENGYFSKEDLSFHDYHIVFINHPGIHAYPSEPTGFKNYISGGGIVVIFLGLSAMYPWGEGYKDGNFLNISKAQGESITSKPNHWLKNIFQKYRFNWKCLLEPGGYLLFKENLMELRRLSKAQSGTIPENADIFEVTATTASRKCVSAVIHLDKGKLILIPIPEKMSVDLIRELLDRIKKNYIKKQQIPEIRPSWIEKNLLFPEIELQTKLNKILKQYEEIKEK